MGVELTRRAHGSSGYGVSTWNKDKLMKHPMDLDIDCAILSILIKMYDLPMVPVIVILLLLSIPSDLSVSAVEAFMLINGPQAKPPKEAWFPT